MLLRVNFINNFVFTRSFMKAVAGMTGMNRVGRMVVVRVMERVMSEL
jgi:hypothetical protein